MTDEIDALKTPIRELEVALLVGVALVGRQSPTFLLRHGGRRALEGICATEQSLLFTIGTVTVVVEVLACVALIWEVTLIAHVVCTVSSTYDRERTKNRREPNQLSYRHGLNLLTCGEPKHFPCQSETGCSCLGSTSVTRTICVCGVETQRVRRERQWSW